MQPWKPFRAWRAVGESIRRGDALLGHVEHLHRGAPGYRDVELRAVRTDRQGARRLLQGNPAHDSVLRQIDDHHPGLLLTMNGLILREREELSYKDIAALTDLPLGTVMSHLARARTRLQAYVTRQQPPGLPARWRRALRQADIASPWWRAWWPPLGLAVGAALFLLLWSGWPRGLTPPEPLLQEVSAGHVRALAHAARARPRPAGRDAPGVPGGDVERGRPDLLGDLDAEPGRAAAVYGAGGARARRCLRPRLVLDIQPTMA